MRSTLRAVAMTKVAPGEQLPREHLAEPDEQPVISHTCWAIAVDVIWLLSGTNLRGSYLFIQ